MNNVPDVILTGEATNNLFGSSVSTAGDVNGDGYADVIVGANGYSSNTGRAYIFFGGTTMNNAADVISTARRSSPVTGRSADCQRRQGTRRCYRRYALRPGEEIGRHSSEDLRSYRRHDPPFLPPKAAGS